VDQIEDATERLYTMCLASVEYVIENNLLDRLAIPEPFWDYVKHHGKRKNRVSMEGSTSATMVNQNPSFSNSTQIHDGPL